MTRITKGKCINYSENTRKRKYWSQYEDDILRQTVQIHGPSWKIIAEYLEGRNASQCAQRWKKVKPLNGKVRQKWDKEEDELLLQLIKEYKGDWKIISQLLPNRTGRQVRERYLNHLHPSINKKAWTPKEDLKIWQLYQRMGSRWSEMAKIIKGRPENMIKNRFYGYIRRKFTKEENPYYVVPQQIRNLNTEQFAQSLNYEECDFQSQEAYRPTLVNLMLGDQDQEVQILCYLGTIFEEITDN